MIPVEQDRCVQDAGPRDHNLRLPRSGALIGRDNEDPPQFLFFQNRRNFAMQKPIRELVDGKCVVECLARVQFPTRPHPTVVENVHAHVLGALNALLKTPDQSGHLHGRVTPRTKAFTPPPFQPLYLIGLRRGNGRTIDCAWKMIKREALLGATYDFKRTGPTFAR